MLFLRLLVAFVVGSLKSQRQLVLENLALRQQVTMLRQSVRRLPVSMADRLFWIVYSRYVNGWRNKLHALHPDRRPRQSGGSIAHYLRTTVPNGRYNQGGQPFRPIKRRPL